MNRGEITKLVEQYRAAMNHADVETLTSLHAMDARVYSPATGLQVGRDAIRIQYRAIFEAFPDLFLRADKLIVDDERAAELWTGTGTHCGGFVGIPASGRTFELSGVFVFEFSAGLIAHEWRIYDVTTLLRQIGLLKASAA